jgi:mandelate racemase
VKTKEGIIGRSYLESYLKDAIRYIGPVILDLAETFKGTPVAPLDLHQKAMGRLHLLGRQGVTLIALAGIDMALWDIRAKAGGLPLVELLGGSVGPVRGYNTNGLWLMPLGKLKREAEELVAEGGFDAIKIRLGRETLRDDLEAIKLVRQAVGDDVKLMCDFNQGLKLDEALLRCHTGSTRRASIGSRNPWCSTISLKARSSRAS